MNKYEYDVKMTCNGCSGAVERALKKAQDNGSGIARYHVDLETQKVVVEGSASYDEVLEKIKKTGKEVLSGKTVVVA